jgi:hypothetical protein
MFRALTDSIAGHSRLIYRGVRMFLRDPASAVLVVRMAAWVFAVSVMMRFLTIPRVLSFLSPNGRTAARVENVQAFQARLAQLLDLVLGTNLLVFTPTCWKRAAVLHRFLALGGVDSRILFGVRSNGDGKLEGHAWLERNGEPLLEPIVPDYKVTYSFPGS